MTSDQFQVAIITNDNKWRDAVSPQIRQAFISCGCQVSIARFRCVEDVREAMDQYLYNVFFIDIDKHSVGELAWQLLQDYSVKRHIVLLSEDKERIFPYIRQIPVRYLHKPSAEPDIQATVVAIVKEQLRHEQHRLCFTLGNGCMVTLDTRAILYIENLNKEQKIVTADTNFWVHKTLNGLLSRLEPCGFLHPHKSFLVNYRFIQSIDVTLMTLKDDTVIPISKHRRKEFLQAYHQLVDVCE